MVKPSPQLMAKEALSRLEDSLRKAEYGDTEIAYIELALFGILKERYDR